MLASLREGAVLVWGPWGVRAAGAVAAAALPLTAAVAAVAARPSWASFPPLIVVLLLL